MPSAAAEAACSGVGGLDHFLSPAEKTARRRYRSPADSLDYAASHGVLRLLAAHRLGVDALTAAALDITRHCPGCGSTDHGRTVLPGASLSLSRSHGMVMAAVGPALASIGADIERVPSRLFDGFDHYVLSPEAAATLEAGTTPAAAATSAAVTTTAAETTGEPVLRERMRHWVAKEAALKAAGLGLTVPPSAVRLVPDRGRPGSVRTVCPDHPLVHELNVHPVEANATHLAAVSARAYGPPEQLDAMELFRAAQTSRPGTI